MNLINAKDSKTLATSFSTSLPTYENLSYKNSFDGKYKESPILIAYFYF